LHNYITLSKLTNSHMRHIGQTGEKENGNPTIQTNLHHNPHAQVRVEEAATLAKRMCTLGDRHWARQLSVPFQQGKTWRTVITMTMETQTETKEKGICDIFGCENEATVFGQTLRFCYEHYSKITHNAGSTIESETETFFDRRKRKVTAKRVAVPMDAGLLAEAKKWNINIEEATRKHFKDVQKTGTKKTVKIEYETVTLKIPAKLMDWLRSMERAEGKTAIQQLEYEIVDHLRANIEALTGEELISLFELDPIFYELLKDERFKQFFPKKA